MPQRQASGAGASLVGVCRARDLVREYYAERITLGDCAAEAGLSPWHLLRSFRAIHSSKFRWRMKWPGTLTASKLTMSGRFRSPGRTQNVASLRKRSVSSFRWSLTR